MKQTIDLEKINEFREQLIKALLDAIDNGTLNLKQMDEYMVEFVTTLTCIMPTDFLEAFTDYPEKLDYFDFNKKIATHLYSKLREQVMKSENKCKLQTLNKSTAIKTMRNKINTENY